MTGLKPCWLRRENGKSQCAYRSDVSGGRTCLAKRWIVDSTWAKKYPDSGITVEPRIVAWATYHESLYVMAAAGVLPDIMILSGVYWPDMAAQGMFLDLEPYILRDRDFNVNDLTPGLLDNIRVKDHLYALPVSALAPAGAMVNLNLDLLGAAGLEVPPMDWTWDDYLVYAKKLTRSSGNQTTQWGSNLGKSLANWGWSMMIGSNGGQIVDPQGKPIVMPVLDPDRLRVNSPEFEEGFQSSPSLPKQRIRRRRGQS